VEILAPPLRKAIVKPLAAYLVQPCAHRLPVVPTDLDALARAVVPGDVVLVEGNTRFASLVRYLTQSTWSHVAMFVGALAEAPDPPCLVEADIQLGIRALPLSELRGMHARVVRATGLDAAERAQVARRVVGRVGQPYDVDCALALGRALWPFGRRDPHAGLRHPRARTLRARSARRCSHRPLRSRDTRYCPRRSRRRTPSIRRWWIGSSRRATSTCRRSSPPSRSPARAFTRAGRPPRGWRRFPRTRDSQESSNERHWSMVAGRAGHRHHRAVRHRHPVGQRAVSGRPDGRRMRSPRAGSPSPGSRRRPGSAREPSVRARSGPRSARTTFEQRP